MQCLYLYPQMGYNQFEFNDGGRAALTFHCGPLLKEVLVAPKVLKVSGKLWFPPGRWREACPCHLPPPLAGCPAETFPVGPSLELMPIHLVNLFPFIKLFILFNLLFS